MKYFLRLWIGELISSIGTGMTSFGLSVYVYERTGNVSAVSLITLLAYMPNILLSPVGGLLADRHDRRMLMITGDLLSGMGLLYILWNICMGNTSLVPIFTGVGISSVFTAFLEPSYKATLTDILPEKEYARASGMIQIANNAKYLISPVIAGFILSVSNIGTVLIIDILTFIITCLIIFSVRKFIGKERGKAENSIKEQIKEGIFTISKNKGVHSLILTMFFVCFFMGTVQVLIRPLILSATNIKTVGMIESICATGILAGSILIGITGIKEKYAEILSVSGIFCGFFMALTGISTNIIITGFCIFLSFIFLPFMNICADTLIRISIPNETQGRIWGAISFVTQAGAVVAYTVSGILADYIFEPAFLNNGLLSGNIGLLIGTGKGGGIRFMFILAGTGLAIISILIGKNKEIKEI